jgi:hypothetical protein
MKSGICTSSSDRAKKKLKIFLVCTTIITVTLFCYKEQMVEILNIKAQLAYHKIQPLAISYIGCNLLSLISNSQ